MSSVHDLAAAYALDAIEGRELRRYEKHLASCDSCPATVDRLREVAGALASTVELDSPEGMRHTVLEQLGTTPQETTSPTELAPSPRLRSWVAIAAVTIAAVGVGAVVGNQLSDNGSLVSEIVAQPDAEVVSLQGPSTAVANFVYSTSLGQGVLVARGLDDIGDDMTYQAWLIGDGEPVPVGLFRADNGNATFEVVGDLAATAQLGVTIEPAGGSPAPTGEIQLVADFR